MGILEPAPASGRIDLGTEPEFDLGTVRVKPAECAIVAAGERRELQPRMMQVLVALSEARPAVVSRQRLIDRCWDGRVVGDDALNRCILGLRHCAQQFTPAPFKIDTVARVGYRLSERKGSPFSGRTLAAAAASAAILAVAAVLVTLTSRPPFGTAGVPTVMVRASSGGAAQGLANDLSLKLGRLQPASAMRLIAGSAPTREPDLVLEVAKDSRKASLALIDSENALLWSSELPASAVVDEQAASNAAVVLGCAVDALGGALSDDIKRMYVQACAATADSKYDPLRSVDMLERIVRAAPRFTPAWAKLLAAETDAVSNVALADGAGLRPALRRHIASARRLKPNLAEAYVAEFVLTAPGNFVRRGALLDTAVATNPAHAAVRAERAMFLESVGRMDDAVQDAVQAVRLDPLSPVTLDTYIRVLAFAGRVDAATAALKDAESRWPGSQSVRAARYAIDLRVGEPGEALRMLRSGEVPTRDLPLYTSFLEARIDRSPAKIQEALRQSRSAYRSNPHAIIGYSQSLAEFGRREEWFDVLLNWRNMDVVDDIADSLFRPAFTNFHRDPRFIRVAKKLGLLGYWQRTGHWPDFCFAPDLPYDCEKEAARIS